MHVTLSQHIVLHLFLFGTAVRAVMYATVPQHIDSPEFSETDPCKGTCMVTQCVWLAIHAAREQHETKKPDQLVTEQRGQKDNERTVKRLCQTTSPENHVPQKENKMNVTMKQVECFYLFMRITFLCFLSSTPFLCRVLPFIKVA